MTNEERRERREARRRKAANLLGLYLEDLLLLAGNGCFTAAAALAAGCAAALATAALTGVGTKAPRLRAPPATAD